jgi:ParB/RepB/Spo0J family partition protein
MSEQIPIKKIKCDSNIRTNIGDLEDLKASIASNGQLSPIVVVQENDETYTCVLGHRRLEAMRQLGKTVVRAEVKRKKDVSANAIARARIAENVVRENLTPLDEARAYDAILQGGESVKGLAASIGVPQTRVRDKIALLRLPESVREKVESGELGATKAAALARAPALAEDVDTAGTAEEVSERVSKASRPQRQTDLNGEEDEVPRPGRKRELKSKSTIAQALARARSVAVQDMEDQLAHQYARGAQDALAWVLCQDHHVDLDEILRED